MPRPPKPPPKSSIGASRGTQRHSRNPQEGIPKLKILDIRPSPPGSATLARFDLELNDHLKLFNLALRRRGDEPAHVIAPNAFQQRVAGFSASFNRALAELALNSLVELQTDHVSVA